MKFSIRGAQLCIAIAPPPTGPGSKQLQLPRFFCEMEHSSMIACCGVVVTNPTNNWNNLFAPIFPMDKNKKFERYWLAKPMVERPKAIATVNVKYLPGFKWKSSHSVGMLLILGGVLLFNNPDN